jgi:hypothetical protein
MFPRMRENAKAAFTYRACPRTPKDNTVANCCKSNSVQLLYECCSLPCFCSLCFSCMLVELRSLCVPLEIALPTVLTTSRHKAPRSFAYCMAVKVSAVSPDCEMKIHVSSRKNGHWRSNTSDASSNVTGSSSMSWRISGSTSPINNGYPRFAATSSPG